MHSLTQSPSLAHFFRQLDPAVRLLLFLFILALCVLACLLGIYSVQDGIAGGNSYLASI